MRGDPIALELPLDTAWSTAAAVAEFLAADAPAADAPAPADDEPVPV